MVVFVVFIILIIMLTIKAPAKINLTLEVLGKRPDGYHEIRSVLQTVDLYDTLYFSHSENIQITSDMKGWSAEKSQVSKAAVLLQEYAGGKKGAEIRIKKRISLRSGLGGDSSDGVAALHGLNVLWKLRLSEEELMTLAAGLGSDAPFFVRGGTAAVSGMGEIVTPLPAVRGISLVLVIPDIPVEPGKTARMYAALKPSHYTDGTITQKLADTLHKDRKMDASMLFNTFENIAYDAFPGLDTYREHLIKLGAPHVHLAGSGPALFVLLTGKTRAEDLYKHCRDQGMKAYLAGTVPM